MEPSEEKFISSCTKNINNNNLSNQLILALDIGTTNLKCSLYDDNLEIINENSTKVISYEIKCFNYFKIISVSDSLIF